MKTRTVSVARVYLTEAEHLLDTIVQRLRDQEHVSGVTVYRGIMGFGASGKIHQADLVDLSLDLPLVIEFFDNPERISETLDHLRELVDPGHIITWSAKLMDAE